MAARQYSEILAWLYGLEAARGMDFKLDRVALALRNLGDPQRRFASVHIAGTNGKGSVAAMLHAMLGAGGYRVGLYTSPHLVNFTERIRTGSDTIAEATVVELTREIQAAATVRGIDLTFFEFVTVLAFLHFARCSIDIAVIEVGLGGRLDATNIIDPHVAVVTTLAVDHAEYLGNTIAAVAREKAGIIKARRPVVVGEVPAIAWRILSETAAAQGARVYRAGREFSATSATQLRFTGLGRDIDAVQLSLRGAYQRDNAGVAIAAALLLTDEFPLTDDAIRRGLGTVHWPGRLEVVQRAPLVVLDGAHNPAGMATLVLELPNIVGTRRVHLLFGVMRDKDWRPMVESIAPSICSATVTAALPLRSERPEVLARAFQPYCTVSVEPDPLQALRAVLAAAAPTDAVVVSGSLFLIGAIYPYFQRRGCNLQLGAGERRPQS